MPNGKWMVAVVPWIWYAAVNFFMMAVLFCYSLFPTLELHIFMGFAGRLYFMICSAAYWWDTNIFLVFTVLHPGRSPYNHITVCMFWLWYLCFCQINITIPQRLCLWFYNNFPQMWKIALVYTNEGIIEVYKDKVC